MQQAVLNGKISCNGDFTKKCESFLEKRYGFKRALLTTSCTHALEMAALLLDLKQGDEVIVPSFAYVSDANAFVLRGATLVFADSCAENPNIDAHQIEQLITKNTKAVLVIHYAGSACDMDAIMAIAKKHALYVIEDAAHSIDSYYKNHVLGTLGHLATFSFHETKNITSGEGGMLVVNDERFLARAEIIREKGTNRQAFMHGQVSKYEWVDLGSSWMPSELSAACLLAQLENIERIQQKRKAIWNLYYENLQELKNSGIQLPVHPSYASNNAHIFYVVCNNETQRNDLIQHLHRLGINAVFHYTPLHLSSYFTSQATFIPSLPACEKFGSCLLRLPLYFDLSEKEVEYICKSVLDFFPKNEYSGTRSS